MRSRVFLMTFEMFHLVMKHCVKCLILRLEQNDFRRRNQGCKNEQFFIWFPNTHCTLISSVFDLWIINKFDKDKWTTYTVSSGKRKWQAFYFSKSTDFCFCFTNCKQWNRAIFEWPSKMVLVSVCFFLFVCFIGEWMKRSKHGLFNFVPKKTLIWRRHCSIGQSCCSMMS